MSKLYYRLNIDEQPLDVSEVKSSSALEIERTELINLTKFSEEKDSFILEPNSVDVFSRYEGKVAIVLLRSDQIDVVSAFLKIVLNKDLVNCEPKKKGDELRICNTPLYKPDEDLYVFFLESGLSKDDDCCDNLYIPIFSMVSSMVIFLDSGSLNEERVLLMMNAFDIYNLKAGSIDSIKEINNVDGTPYLFYISPQIVFVVKNEEAKTETLRVEQEKILTNIRLTANDKYRRSIKIIDQHFLGIDVFALHEENKNLESNFKSKIFRTIKSMELNGIDMSVRMLLSFLAGLIDSQGDKKLVNVKACWDIVVENEVIFEYNNAVDFYKETLKEFFQDDSPKPPEDLIRILGSVRDNSIIKYDQTLLKLKNNSFVLQYRGRLLQFLEQKERLAFQLNDDLKRSIIGRSIEKEVSRLEANIKANEYKNEKFPVFLEDIRGSTEKLIKLPGGSGLDSKLLRFYKDSHIRMYSYLFENIINNIDREEEFNIEDSAIYRPQEITLAERKKLIAHMKDENRKMEKEVTQTTQNLKAIQKENMQSSKVTSHYLEIIKVERGLEARLEDIKNELRLLKQKKKKAGCCSK